MTPADEYLDEEVIEYPEVHEPFYIDDFEVIDATNELDAIGLFSYAATQNCSDIHLVPGAPPKLRINGDLVPIEGFRVLTTKDTDDVRQQTMSNTDLGQFVKKVTTHDYAYDLPGVGRFRIKVARSVSGLTMTARKLVDIPPTFDDLGTNQVIRDLANLHSGLVLVSGITGSGKSTLMSAIVNAINFERADNIISIEDPVEIVHRNQKSNVIQRSVGTDVANFTDGVSDAMRQDPDVILIGEIKDIPTARACLQAAESGHLVISTVHAITSVASIGRILDMFPSSDVKSVRNKFAEVLRAIIGQKLVRSTAETGERLAVNEILLSNSEIQEMIINDAPSIEIRKLLEKSGHYGMQTFEQDFLRLVKANSVSKTVALAQATDQHQMKEMLADVPDAVPVKKFTLPKVSPTPTVPVKPFSQIVEEEAEEKGVVVHPSGAAPSFRKAPSRPDVFIPRRG